MSNPIETRSPLAYARALRDDPEGALAALDDVRRLPPDERRALDDLVRASRDPDMAAALAGFVRSAEFQGCDEGHRSAVLDALRGEPTPKAVGRLMLLAGDAEFRGMSPLSSESEIRAVLDGLSPMPAAWMIERAGVRRPVEHVSPTVAVDVASHAVEVAVEPVLEATAVHATTRAAIAAGMEFGAQAVPLYVGPSAVGTVAAAAFPAVAAVAGLYGTLHEIAEAHEQARRERDARQFASGFSHTLSAIVGGDDPPARSSGPHARGAAAAERAWDDLDPAQRVALREHSREFLADLRRSVERAMTGSSR